MTKFHQLPEFTRELKRLSKKYPSLLEDIQDVETILMAVPTGIGKNFVILQVRRGVQIIKVRLHCQSLQNRSIRLIYAYHSDRIEFIYIEMYFKGDKDNENKERIQQYLDQL